MPAGRPTKFHESMCDRVIELMYNGASKVECARELGIAMSTFDVWQNENEQFKEAVKIGTSFSQGWWESEGRLSLRDKDFNYTGWYMNMKNRFGWKDKHEHSDPSGGPAMIIYCPKEEDK